mmetsp:Transcript_23513/g.41564  ORF Transcript_23513/g.41564 Transcript_23513/m.41564 type:complete len:83 (-) Transcript_23513:238-486(-)
MVEISKVRAPKDWRNTRTCAREMNALLTCWRRTNYEDGNCTAEVRALDVCFERTPMKSKKAHKPTTNFHLQRLAKSVINKVK